MLMRDAKYHVVRTLPRKGEVYAVRDRETGITTLRVADHDFTHDKRDVLVLTSDNES